MKKIQKSPEEKLLDAIFGEPEVVRESGKSSRRERQIKSSVRKKLFKRNRV